MQSQRNMMRDFAAMSQVPPAFTVNAVVSTRWPCFGRKYKIPNHPRAPQEPEQLVWNDHRVRSNDP